MFILNKSSKIFLIISFLLLSACSNSDTNTNNSSAPEITYKVINNGLYKAYNYMVVSANPVSSRVGKQIIDAGGNAIDAYIAMQLVLTLVEPQSSGLGGGGFVVYYPKGADKVVTYDGREIAPKKANVDLFKDKEGNIMSWPQAVVGGKSVGVPSMANLLVTLHEKYGRLNWELLVQPAIDLARDGFKISSRMHNSINSFKSTLMNDKIASEYFLDKEGNAKLEGTLLKNPDLEKTLISLRDNKSYDFYKGYIAKDIVKKVKNAKYNKGIMELSDLENFSVKEREAVCFKYKVEYNICGMDSPSSGTITVAMILNILSNFDLSEYNYILSLNKI